MKGSPLAANAMDRQIDGIKGELRRIYDTTRAEVMGDGRPPGTVPVKPQNPSPLLRGLGL